MAAELLEIERNPLWSATPTPLTDDMEIDVAAVRRLVDHHLKLGVTGLFIAGTSGEGPWMPDRLRRDLMRAMAEHAKGKLHLAFQVTDNSAPRILDNMARAAQDGADLVVISAPRLVEPPTPDRVLHIYQEAIRQSPLPVGIYDAGDHGPVPVPNEVMAEIIAEEKVVLVKDSSCNAERRDQALAARRQRPNLRLLSGDEFDCVSYLQAGYDGLLLGGGIFNGYLARQIMAAVAAGDEAQAQRLQERLNHIMWSVYGGKELLCWMSGLKHLCVRMGLFTTANRYLEYPLLDECAREIDRVLAEDRDVFFPWESKADG